MTSHKPSGETCCVYHFEDGGKPCQVCIYCDKFIRPSKINEECPKGKENENKKKI